jgi:hypothetical protein
MLYSTTGDNATFRFNLYIDLYLKTIETSMKNVRDNPDKSEALESITVQIQALREEINNPVILKKCTYKSGDSDVVNDEEIRNYLFSILTPKKLQTLRKWLKNKDNIIAHPEYKVDIILHVYSNTLGTDMYAGQPLTVNNGIGECNIPLEALINLIDKTAEYAINSSEDGDPTPEVVIGEVKILRKEIFTSNSTVLYTHEPSNFGEASDDETKDYLFSMLSPEKLKALKKWLYNEDSILSKTGHKVWIITSIYVPDL